MRKSILIVLAVLSACATNDIRNRPPSFELASSVSAHRVATCIVGRWTDAKVHETEWGLPTDYPISMRTIAGGYSVSAIANNLSGTSKGVIADIEDTARGSTIRYFKSGLGSADPFEDAVRECQ